MPREKAEAHAKAYLYMGDGASVKNVRLMDEDGDEIIPCHNFGKKQKYLYKYDKESSRLLNDFDNWLQNFTL